jgi:hypothetical protein
MNDALKQTLKRVLPESFLKVARYFRPQRRFDRRFSVETCGVIDPEQLDVMDSRDASGYEPTDSGIFSKIMSSIQIDYSRFAFVDMGSGKGAVILYASAFPFKKIIGVEFSSLLHRIAEQNIARFHSQLMKCKNVMSLCMDVTNYQLPSEPTVLYLFNPFKGRALDKVIANTKRSLKDHPRDIAVVYYHPVCRHSAWDRADFLRQVRREQDHTIYVNSD